MATLAAVVAASTLSTAVAADGTAASRSATAATTSAAAAKILFDTDMDSDCDDLGALAALHALADRGEAEILATTVSSLNKWSAPCVDAINTFYGRPDLPIGAPKGVGAQKPSKYAERIAAEFPHDLTSGDDAPDARRVYRDALAAQPDHSVTVVTVGYLTNVADLLREPAADGRQSGADLVRAKVKRWVCMGGNFVGSPPHDDLKLTNNNFTFDKAASLYAVKNWPVELVFVGREIGSVPSGLKAGARLAELPDANPIRRGYALYFGGAPKDRHVADQTTVLFAVRGAGDW
ncbi:MAG: nucleoside hydrolase, partial [Phycisphaerales bacterium]|nr:nucleoside hydrolase [Phycisphaerales bacterium]